MVRILLFIIFNTIFLRGIASAQEPEVSQSDSALCKVNLVMGYHNYIPNLSSIRNDVMHFDDSPGMYFALYIPAKEDKTWAMLGYSRYKGYSSQQDIKISNIFLDWATIASEPGKHLAIYLALGTNLIYMERKFSSFEHIDWLWGLNALIGASIRVAGPLYAGYEIGYMWSKQSTLGGKVYDLSDTIQSFTFSLMVF